MTSGDKIGKILEGLLRGILLLHVILAVLFISSIILIGLFGFILYWEHSDVEWSAQGYYLQHDKFLLGEKEHSLFYKIDEKKELILPQVYGYEKEEDAVYFAAVHGYGFVNLKEGTLDIVLKSMDVPQIENATIFYHDDLSFFDEETQRKLTALPHTLIAYFWDKDRAKTVGDGRFQCMRFYGEDDSSSYLLEVYGTWIDSWHNTLLPSLNGFRIEKKSQMMYVTSSQGYAIVDGPHGTCRVYFTDQELAEKEYQKDIHVLDSFDDFTPEEQEMLRQVEKEGLP